MSKTHYIPGGEVALLPESVRKDGQGTFPASVLIATRRGKLIIPAETAKGLLEVLQTDHDIQALLAKVTA